MHALPDVHIYTFMSISAVWCSRGSRMVPQVHCQMNILTEKRTCSLKMHSACQSECIWSPVGPYQNKKQIACTTWTHVWYKNKIPMFVSVPFCFDPRPNFGAINLERAPGRIIRNFTWLSLGVFDCKTYDSVNDICAWGVFEKMVSDCLWPVFHCKTWFQ